MESIIILSVRSKEGTVPLVVIDGESDGKKTKYTITEGTYREIGCPLSGEVLEDEEAVLPVSLRIRSELQILTQSVTNCCLSVS